MYSFSIANVKNIITNLVAKTTHISYSSGSQKSDMDFMC